jgi:hypothetical protein
MGLTIQGQGFWVRVTKPVLVSVNRLWVTMLVSKQEARNQKFEYPVSIYQIRYELRHQ